MNNTVTKKFQFGAGFGEILNETLAIEQMRARNFLRNSLVELDRKTREQYSAIVNASNPAHERIQTINAEIETLRVAIKILRVPKEGEKSGKRRVKVGPCVEKERIEALKKERTDLKPIAAATRSESKQNSATALAELTNERKEAVNALRIRAIAGYLDERVNKQVPALYNLNADEIIAQHDTERTRAMKEKTQLRFHSSMGEGRSSVRVHSHRDLSGDKAELFAKTIAVIDNLKQQRREATQKKQLELKQSLSEQIEAQKIELERVVPNFVGQSEEETFSGESSLFRLDAVQLARDAENPTVWDKSVPRGERRRLMRTVAHIRINSTEKRTPIFVSLPVVVHRPFPAGAKILSAAVNRKKIASQFRWNVEFTLRYTETPQLREAEGTVAIDLGWAKDSLTLPDGRIRVSGVRQRGEDGTETFAEFCLPPEFAAHTKKLDDIQAIRDQKTNEAFAAIAAFREHNEIEDTSLRELLDEAKRSLTAREGKTPPVHHLRTAVWMLRKQNVEGELRAILETWYKRWMHLNNWLANGRDNVLAWKRDYYRRFSHRLAQRNKLLLLDADNFAKMAKTPAAETDRVAAKNDLRHGVAPAMLRSALEAAFEQTLWSSLSSSKTCRKCWYVNETLGAGRVFTCSACGHMDDRESNATGNILDEFVRKPGSFSSDKRVCAKLAERKEQEALEISESSKSNRAGQSA